MGKPNQLSRLSNQKVRIANLPIFLYELQAETRDKIGYDPAPAQVIAHARHRYSNYEAGTKAINGTRATPGARTAARNYWKRRVNSALQARFHRIYPTWGDIIE